MKNILIFVLFSFSILYGQENQTSTQATIQVGDKLIIGKPSGQHYQHVLFPKTNFIIKKGGIANFKKIVGNSVTVTQVSKNKEGQTKISIKKTDGKKFFNSIVSVKANLEAALNAKEIILTQ